MEVLLIGGRQGRSDSLPAWLRVTTPTRRTRDATAYYWPTQGSWGPTLGGLAEAAACAGWLSSWLIHRQAGAAVVASRIHRSSLGAPLFPG